MGTPVTIDPRLFDYASERQRPLLEAINEHGSILRAAEALGRSRATLQDVVRRVKAKAAVQGFSPEHDMVHPVPETHVAKGVSTLFVDGKIKSQWVKSALKDDAVEDLVRNMVLAMVEDVRGQSKPVASPAISNADLLVVYPFGDPHLGMRSTAAETGDDFNLEIAEGLIMAAVDNLVASAPPAETAILLNLGDALHADDQTNQTARSKAQLDVDGRWTDILRVGLRVMIYCINKALEKHPKVIVRNVCGNHDKHSGFAIALALDAFFSNNERVTVDLSPSAFWFYRFDQVLIGSTHGDQCRKEALPGVMACDRAADWGQTKFRQWLVGHVHHEEVKEYPGVTVESFRTLAGKDAWHAASGYRSGRDMRCIIYHRKYGEIGRYRCDVSMIEQVAKPQLA